MRRSLPRRCAALAACFPLSACTVRFQTLGGEPPSRPVPRIAAAAPIDVSPAPVSVAGRTIVVSPFDVVFDYAEFTAAAVNQVRAELERQGVATADGVPKRIEIGVMYVDIVRSAFTFSCLVDFRAATGDGVARGLQARATSWNYREACREAIGGVALETLSDAGILRYLAAASP